MNPRRITLTLGAAAGGLLAAASLPMAVAFADDTFGFTGGSTEDVVGVSGIPPLDEDIQGTELIDFNDTTLNALVSAFPADVATLTTASGFSNSEIIVTGPGTPVDVFPNGTVLESTNFASGWQNTYSDLVGAGTNGTNQITDTFVTPFGSFNIPTAFDASAAYLATPAAFTNGNFTYEPDSSGETVTSIGGIAPLSQTVSGTQIFDVDATSGNATALLGEFNADVTTRSGVLGASNEQIYVASDLAANPATGQPFPGPTDEPHAGSVFDTNVFASGWENIYSDVAGSTPSADTITDTFVTPFGNFNIPTDFDASAVAFSNDFNSPDGSTYVPVPSGETVTSVGGIPPLWETVSGTQTFDTYDATNPSTPAGNFEADVTNLSVFGITNEQIVDISDGGGSDEPPTNSVFDTTVFASGWENVYADFAGSTPSISDTFVTPFGDFSIPIDFDVSALFPS